MGLKTTEPVLTQVALSAGGMLFGAVLTARSEPCSSASGLSRRAFTSLPGSTSARCGCAARRWRWWRPAPTSPWPRSPPETAPLWPKYDAENAWLPLLSQALAAVKFLAVIGFAIVALDWLSRVTEGWTRHRLLAVVLLMLTNAAIAAISAEQWFDIAAAGLVVGALAALFFATVLRFDLRAIPPLIAVYASLMIVAQALQKGTPQAAYLGAVGVAATLAVGWAATRYLVAAGPAAEASPVALNPRRGRQPGVRIGSPQRPVCALLDGHPVGNDVVVGAVHRAHVRPRCPGNHLPMQRQVEELVVLDHERLVDEAAAPVDVDFGLDLVDERVQLGIV